MKIIKSSLSGVYTFSILCFCLFALNSCGPNSHISKTKNRPPAPSRREAGAESHNEARVESSREQEVISAARGFMGTPYKWGGTTRSGMDCSGLLVSSFRVAQIELPRTSADQSNYGKRVGLQELRPGDLVFFAAKKGRGKISHVGMVTEVRGPKEVIFIHASTSLGVVESNLHADYYRKIFIKAQRPF